MPVFPPALTMGEFNLFVAAMCTSMVNGQEIRKKCRVANIEWFSHYTSSQFFSYSLSYSCARAYCSRNFFLLVLPTRCKETQLET